MLTIAQINTINRARDVLERLQKKASESDQKPFTEGQLAEACMAAELALFNVLNLAGDIPDEHLFNRKGNTNDSGNGNANGADGALLGPLRKVLDSATPGGTVA